MRPVRVEARVRFYRAQCEERARKKIAAETERIKEVLRCARLHKNV